MFPRARTGALGIVAASCCVHAGCRSDPSPLSDAPWAERRPLWRELETERPTDPAAPPVVEAVPLPTQTEAVSLRRALALAVARSPRLRAYAWDVRTREAEALQAGLWSNPELGLEIEEFGGSDERSGFDETEFTLSLAQTFPLGGDADRRRKLADRQSELAGWDYEAARLEVIRETTERYVRALAVERRVKIAEQEVEIAEAVLVIAERRVDAGASPQVERARAQVPVAEARVRLRQSRRDLITARRTLALSWGQRDRLGSGLTGDLDQLAPPPDPNALAALVASNPDVARWATKISERRARAELAEAESTPDVTASLGAKRFNGNDETAFVIGVSLPLPLFDRRQGDALAARLGAASAEERRAAAELRVERRLSDAWTRLADAHDESTALADEALPPAVEAFEATRRAFENGDVQFLDVLDAERTLVRLRTQRAEALAAYHLAVADLESLIGRPLSAVPPAPSPHNTRSEPSR